MARNEYIYTAPFPILLPAFNLLASFHRQGGYSIQSTKKKIPPPYIEQRTLPILALHLHSNTFTLARASFLLVRWITWPEYLLLYDREISLITGHSNAYHGVDRGFEPVHVINADTRLTFINAAFARSFRKIPLTSTVYHCSRTRHLSVDGNGMEL